MVFMKGVISIVVGLLTLVHAREQIAFSFHPEQERTVVPRHHQPWSILVAQSPHTSNCTLLSVPELSQHHREVSKPGDVVVVNKTASTLAGVKGEKAILEIIGYDTQALRDKTEELCSSLKDQSKAIEIEAEYEVRKLHYSGDPSNRIDFVMMGDGYTKKERKKFFKDMNRITQDLFQGDTFKSIIPILNVWAVFTPSVESGIGVNGRPKDTVFGLFRDGTELRAIFPTYKDEARKVCRSTGPFACDYPILIGNDDYYGGLGGEFVISTSSITSGTIVIRHELGHNLIDVGEEYDGGWVYSGVNAAHSLPPSWSHWLTNISAASHEERNRVIFQEYPWLDLSPGSWRKVFYTDGHDGGWERVYIQASASGVPDREDLWVGIDGNELDWYPTGNDDRRFLEWHSKKGFAPGFHVIEFRQNTKPKKGRMPRQLCSIEIIEYGAEEEFHQKKGYIGNFPTYDIYGRKTWRPTNEGCLMRHMQETTFCNVCQEGLWTNLMRRLAINLTPVKDENMTISLQLLEFGQLRPSPFDGEKYRISWRKDGVLFTKYDDQVKIKIPIFQATGTWKVEVQLLTDEVRKDSNGVLQDSAEFEIE